MGSATFNDRLKKMIEASVKRASYASRNKISITIMAAGGVVVVALAVTSLFFARGTVEFKSKYSKTAALYESTLAMLEKERAVTIAGQGDVEEVAWKIRLTEGALQELKEKKADSLKDEKALDGYRWNIKIRQTNGSKTSEAAEDVLGFSNNTVTSVSLGKEGFAGTPYSKRETKEGVIEWETIQRNGRGETMNWRGAWNGETMSGVLRGQYKDGSTKDFSFVSEGARAKDSN